MADRNRIVPGGRLPTATAPVAVVHAPRTDPDIMRSLVDGVPTSPALPCIASYAPGEVFNGAEVISRTSSPAGPFIRTGGGRLVSAPSPSSPTCLPMAQRPGTLPAMGFRTDRHSTAAVCSAALAQIAVSANPPTATFGQTEKWRNVSRSLFRSEVAMTPACAKIMIYAQID